MSGGERGGVIREGSGTRRLRVCLVGPSLDILGGQAVQLDRLRRRLAELPGLTVSFVPVNPRLPGPLRMLQRVKYLRTVATTAAYVARLIREIPSHDIVHAFSASYWSYLLAPLPAMLVGRLFGKAVILNYRSGEADDHLGRMWPVSKRSLRLAHAIVVPSGYLVEVFGRHGLAARPIPNFVDRDQIPFRERVVPGPVFLSNRNLEQLYNVSCAIRAFARVQREYPEASLIVAGDGRERTALERLVQELGVRNVTFRGRLAPDALAALYDEADIYLNSPNIDNMPNSILEAFTAGLPVVSTSAGGIPFIVRHGENGLLVPPNDDAALGDAALRLLREPGLALQLTQAARSDVAAKYVWPAVSGEWEDVYAAAARSARVTGRGDTVPVSPAPSA